MRIFFIVLGVLALSLSPASAQLNPICGDCDLDNRVTVSDTVLALQAANGTAPVTVDDRCDVDLGGYPSAGDGLLIAQFSAGLLPTLTCTGEVLGTAGPPTPSLDPFNPAFGNCVQGQSMGNAWNFSILGNFGEQAATVPAVPRSSTAFDLAAAWANVINNSPSIPNYQAIPYSGTCFIVLDQNFNQAYVRIFAGGGSCVPDLTGAPCAF